MLSLQTVLNCEIFNNDGGVVMELTGCVVEWLINAVYEVEQTVIRPVD